VHPSFFGRAQVKAYVTEGINDRSRRLAATSEQIGRCHRICVQKLAQNHYLPPRGEGRSLDMPSSFNYSFE
jgi:hypothetical protein